ncbi:MAG: GNAT family N-acetyltransferase [Gammaproteobacteria bacterium]
MEIQRPLPIVRVFGDDEDQTPLRRFWYETYVEEMGRDQDQADHEKRELPDARSHIGEVIVAQVDGNVVGTLICTPSWTRALGDYEALYDMQRLGNQHPNNTGVITKLMVAPEYRQSRLSIRISRELYRHAVPLGVHHALIDCNEHLLSFFLRLGFLPFGPPVRHPAYGHVHVLKLDCLDLDNLRHMRSPLLSTALQTAPLIKTSDPKRKIEGVPA